MPATPAWPAAVAPAAYPQLAAGPLEGRCRHADGAGGGRKWLSPEGFDHRGRDYDICKRRSLRCAVSAGVPATLRGRGRIAGRLGSRERRDFELLQGVRELVRNAVQSLQDCGRPARRREWRRRSRHALILVFQPRHDRAVPSWTTACESDRMGSALARWRAETGQARG